VPGVPWLRHLQRPRSSTPTTSATRASSRARSLLIVGTSYSAEDIGLQCWKYGAKSITWPTAQPHGLQLARQLEGGAHPQKVEGNTATFKDGSTARVDAIILCTGYKHHFPFLGRRLAAQTKNRLATADLYKGGGLGP
jgi:trimethylamine monooxygenase